MEMMSSSTSSFRTFSIESEEEEEDWRGGA
jgi:hypothetical protein